METTNNNTQEKNDSTKVTTKNHDSAKVTTKIDNTQRKKRLLHFAMALATKAEKKY